MSSQKFYLTHLSTTHFSLFWHCDKDPTKTRYHRLLAPSTGTSDSTMEGPSQSSTRDKIHEGCEWINLPARSYSFKWYVLTPFDQFPRQVAQTLSCARPTVFCSICIANTSKRPRAPFPDQNSTHKAKSFSSQNRQMFSPFSSISWSQKDSPIWGARNSLCWSPWRKLRTNTKFFRRWTFARLVSCSCFHAFMMLEVCPVWLKFYRENIASYPRPILVHGIKHDYPALVSKASMCLARVPLLKVIDYLPVHALTPWVRSISILYCPH